MTGEQITCKFCGSTDVKKYGFIEGVQKYLCKACGRKFSADDRLYRMKTPAHQVSSALNQYYSGMSINEVRQYLLQEYGNYPSSRTVYAWIQKFTDEAVTAFKDYHPKVGDVWIADETVLKIDGANVWMYDIIDRDTRFLLSSRVTTARTTNDAQKLMEAAARRAGKNPQVVITDQNNSYLDGIEQAYGSDTEHRLGGPFKVEKERNTNLIERFHGTLKSRTKTMRGLKSIDTAITFTDGYLVYYDFFRPHEKLDGKTPAEAAGVAYDIKTWADVVRNISPKVEVLTTPQKVIVVSEVEPLVRPIQHRHYGPNRKRLKRHKRASEATITLSRTRGR